MNNPVVLSLVGLNLHAFTAALLIPALLSMSALWVGAQHSQQSTLRWIDAGLGALIGSVIGARLFHVLLEWPYFSANLREAFSLPSGGLDWHGAVLGGLIGLWIACRVRNLRMGTILDVFAMCLPLFIIGVWVGCGASANAYGREVRTLADYPAWAVVEAPDIYGSIAPRLNLPTLGTLIGLLVIVLIGILFWRGWAPGRRFWIILGLYSLANFLIGFLRGDFVAMWFGLRADQVLDLSLVLLTIVILGYQTLSTRGRVPQSESLT